MVAKVHLLDFIIPMVAEAGSEDVSLAQMEEIVREVNSDPMGQWYLEKSRMGQHNHWGDQAWEENPVTYKVNARGHFLKLDLNQGVIYGPQGTVLLTPTETRLLECLARQPGVIVSHSVLSDIISQDHTGAVWTDPKYHIRNLRIKLGDNLQHPGIIKSRRGMGYYLEKNNNRLVIG
jgi:DNA-binding response OmpR family regulator